MTISPGQVYRACAPVRSEPRDRYIRIMITHYPILTVGLYGHGKVQIGTLTDDGRVIRTRAINMSELHDTRFTLAGDERRTGYYLETDN